MDLWTFIWASVLSRAFQFMLVGALFWKFGPPIKNFIDKYLAWVTAGFLVLVVGGFIAFSMLAGGGAEKSDKCSNVVKMQQMSPPA
jgi:membrane protein DedA with SNARE-associated domain